MAKKHFFGQKFLWQANKNSFELKMPKFLENHVQERIFCFLTYLKFFEFLTKKCKKCVFLEKNQNFGSFFLIIRKI